MMVLRTLGGILVLLGTIPLVYLGFLAVVAWILPRRRQPGEDLRVAVLIPAHNEASMIGHLLGDLRAQSRPCQSVLVVAHNCSDGTAEVARAGGAEVLILTTGSEKADALEAGFAWLASREWDAALILDADCRIPPDFLAEARGARAEVVQSRYLLEETDPRSGVVYSFFYRLDEAIFHSGRERLGCLAFLRGTGMLLGRDALSRSPWAARGLTEDRSQTYAFFSAGVSIRFNERIRVLAAPPQHARESWNQRRRWLSTSLPSQILEAGRAARHAQRHLGMKVWELPLAVWADARSQWVLLLLAGTLLVAVSGGPFAWGLVLPGIAALVGITLGVVWYRAHFLRVLVEGPLSAVVILGAAMLSLAGRRPSAWKRGR